MANIKENMDDISVYIEDREYIANKYVMKCFFITMLFFIVSFVLNILNIFVVNQHVMASGFYPSLIIYFIIYFATKKVSLSDERVKYFILFGVMVVYTIMGVTITYHVVLASLLPLLYATLYSNKRVMHYVYIMTVLSTIVIVYGGYYWGLCDANMTLLTTGRLSDYVSNGQFTLTTVNPNPMFTLFLFFVLPRCLIYFAFMFVCNNILRIVSGSIEKAKLTDELEKAKIEAENANRAKSRFLARVSHEIRTPINAILGMNEMILRESKENEIRKYASDVKDSSVILLNIINELLDSSKIESGKMELVPVRYKIGSLLNDLYNMNNVRAKEKNLKLVFDIAPDMPNEFFGDDKRIHQILMNLLNNAVKYTNKGTVTLKVRCQVVEDTATLYFLVKDTGIGIKQEDIGKLQDEFQRMDLCRNRNIEGSGLGMSIVQQLLKLMGSELHIESEYEKGSEFSFSIEQKVLNKEPLGEFQNIYLQQEEETAYKSTFTAPNAKILVVDDVEMNRVVFKSLLKQTQVQIFEASGGQECLDMLSKETFHMVFLDHMMPEMDGIETKHRITEQKLCEGVPIIMLTANAILSDREMYMKEGFDDFLSKPILVNKLEEIIRKHLPQEVFGGAVEAVAGENMEKAGAEETKYTLPQLDEFDLEYALSLLQDEEVLCKLLTDFHVSLAPMKEKLAALYQEITQEGMLVAYRTQVHSLKSTAANVGAMLLSKTARLLEVAAIEGNVDRIHVLHPVLLEELEKHEKRLATIAQPKDEKKHAEKVEKSYLDMLKLSLKNQDFNTADFVCAELQKYQFPAETQELVDELIDKVFALEAEEALQILDKMVDY